MKVTPETALVTLGLALALIVCPGVTTARAGALEPIRASAHRDAGEADDPHARWQWFFEQRAFPAGDIPWQARSRALDEIAAARGRGGLAAGEAVPGNHWMNIGPAPIIGGQIGNTGNARPVSGRVAAVAVDPRNASRWLIGAADGGVWESTDTGQTWVPRTDAAASLAIGAIAFAPSDPQVVYAGTGEGIAALAGAGVLKSVDGGEFWRLIAAETFAGATIRRIRVDPNNRDTLLVASRGGDRAADAKRQSETGILKSSDGGTTWIHPLRGRASGLEVDAFDFTRQYAAIGVLGGTQPDPTPVPGEPTPVPNGVYRSFNGGDDWENVAGPWDSEPGGVGRIELALSRSDPNVLYVSIANANDEPENESGKDGTLLGLWRTVNAWDAPPAWERIALGGVDDGFQRYGYCGWNLTAESKAPMCDYSHTIIVDRNDPMILYAGGIQLYRLEGRRWVGEVSQQLRNPAGGIHVDQQDMVWSGDRLIVVNDGGVWSTRDGGDTWEDHNTTLSITQFYAGSLHPTDPFFALGGSQDNGTELWTGSEAWRWISAGDGGPNAISDSDPARSWAVSAQRLVIGRTTDGGKHVAPADDGIDDNGRADPDRIRAPFIARLEKCPHDENVFIAGTDNVWKTSDFFTANSPRWSANSPPLAGDAGEPVGISALAFAAADRSCRTYALGAFDGRLLRSVDGGRSWVDLDPNDTVPRRFVTGLAFVPDDANVLYVTLSGFDISTPNTPGHLFRSTNALSDSPTWANVGPPVDLPHNAMAVDPRDPQTLYVATDIGIWRTRDGGATWLPMGPETGMPNVLVMDLKINPTTNRIVAFTHGRGAFALEVAADTPTPTPTPSPISTPRPPFTLGPCVGDCDHSGKIGVNDLVLGTSIALGKTGIERCPSFDTDGSNTVQVSELVRGVNGLLHGCAP